MTIFSKKSDDVVAVPEIEVYGNEAILQASDGVREQDRKVELPKTIWA